MTNNGLNIVCDVNELINNPMFLIIAFLVIVTAGLCLYAWLKMNKKEQNHDHKTCPNYETCLDINKRLNNFIEADGHEKKSLSDCLGNCASDDDLEKIRQELHNKVDKEEFKDYIKRLDSLTEKVNINNAILAGNSASLESVKKSIDFLTSIILEKR